MVEAFAHPAGSIAVGVPGGAVGWRGTLLAIHIASAASYEMEELAEARCVAGRGIEGDRYYLGSGTYSPKPDTREVTLIEQEALDAINRNDPPLQAGPLQIAPIDHRRNLTVRGVPLNHLVGRRFRVGEVILRGGRLNFRASIWRSCSACRSTCRSTTARGSIAGSSAAASCAPAIPSKCWTRP
jgi:hypothetical protein